MSAVEKIHSPSIVFLQIFKVRKVNLPDNN